uniref:Uncharacterized protein n=1 Tax=Psilocybe cubensis TaxID=181762 RepID=A0A8H7XPS6_PSICU
MSCSLPPPIRRYHVDERGIINADLNSTLLYNALMDSELEMLMIVGNSFFYGVFIVADTLLIWRCFHVWGRSRRILTALLVCLFIETALFAGEISISLVSRKLPSVLEVVSANDMQSAQALISFATTIISTFLIAYKIHKLSTPSSSSSRNLFKHIVMILVESAAVYSLSILVFAIFNLIPATDNLHYSLSYAKLCTQVIVTVIGGMAPTILVARVALPRSDGSFASTISHISGIETRNNLPLSAEASATGETRAPHVM